MQQAEIDEPLEDPSTVSPCQLVCILHITYVFPRPMIKFAICTTLSVHYEEGITHLGDMRPVFQSTSICSYDFHLYFKLYGT